MLWPRENYYSDCRFRPSLLWLNLVGQFNSYLAYFTFNELETILWWHLIRSQGTEHEHTWVCLMWRADCSCSSCTRFQTSTRQRRRQRHSSADKRRRWLTEASRSSVATSASRLSVAPTFCRPTWTLFSCLVDECQSGKKNLKLVLLLKACEFIIRTVRNI